MISEFVWPLEHATSALLSLGYVHLVSHDSHPFPLPTLTLTFSSTWPLCYLFFGGGRGSEFETQDLMHAR